MILRRIFDRNQLEFTAAEPKTIPTIAVVEEAQAVLNERGVASEPYIAWVKEGRKYDLGAVLITQQPGSIPTEILSQGDNWFIFHLLSATDLNSIKNANAHFSQDILSAILNEPIPGQGVFWSSASRKPFPVAIRVLDFEKMYLRHDHNYNQPAAKTFASKLKEDFEESLEKVTASLLQLELGDFDDEQDFEEDEYFDDKIDEVEVVDLLKAYKFNAINKLKRDTGIIDKLKSEQGLHWRGIMEALKVHLPPNLDDVDTIVYQMVRDALDEVFGSGNWETYKNQRGTTYARGKNRTF